MKPVELIQVHKRFGDRPVLRGLTLRIEPGETVGFVGPNGAGKTTCLRIMLGLLERDEGQCRMFGMDPQRDAVRIREHCCYLPGETSLYQGMRGKEFLRFALSFYPRQQDDIRLDLLQAFALPLQKKVRSYSAGMKQKLALMATLIPDVQLYVLDEPDRALDATTRFFLRDLLGKLRRRGKTILLSSHHLHEVEALADRLVFLMDGAIIADARVSAARETLSQRLRIKLRAGCSLPDGARLIHTEMDGSMHIEPDTDPLRWLARIPTEQLISAELGTVRLEDLYRVLTEEASA